MRSAKVCYGISFFLCVLFFSSSAAFAQYSSSGDQRSLGDVARETREQRKLHASQPNAQSSKVLEMSAELSLSDPDEYEEHARSLLEKQDYAALERMADRARSNKSRFVGGGWKLYSFYQALATPQRGRNGLDAFAWNQHTTKLNAWTERMPDSSTPLIALAATYLARGHQARGDRYAEDVPEYAWKEHDADAEMARKLLMKARTLSPTCQYWYEAMMEVALAQGWGKEQTRSLFNEAMQFDPSYYHTIREYAFYLTTKWYGDEGEAEAFAKEIADQIGGEEGDFVYFEVASVVCSEWENNASRSAALSKLSWPRIKNGFDVLQRRYGISRLKVHRFTLMAGAMHDDEATHRAMMMYGKNPQKQ